MPLLVLLVPLAAPSRIRVPRAGVLRSVVYFPALALGFLFIEIYLIEKASFWLGDRTSGFAMVLTGMLVFSGLGSLLHLTISRRRPRHGMAVVAAVVLRGASLALLFLEPLILSTLDWPFIVRGSAAAGVDRTGLGRPRPAFPAGPEPGGDRRVPALGVGAERRIFRGGDAACEPDCA